MKTKASVLFCIVRKDKRKEVVPGGVFMDIYERRAKIPSIMYAYRRP